MSEQGSCDTSPTFAHLRPRLFSPEHPGLVLWGKNSLWVYISSSESHLSSSGTFLELRVFFALWRSHVLCFPDFLLYLFDVT